MRIPKGGEVWYNSKKYYFVVNEQLIYIDSKTTVQSFEDLISNESMVEKISIFGIQDGWNFVHSNWREFLEEISNETY